MLASRAGPRRQPVPISYLDERKAGPGWSGLAGIGLLLAESFLAGLVLSVMVVGEVYPFWIVVIIVASAHFETLLLERLPPGSRIAQLLGVLGILASLATGLMLVVVGMRDVGAEGWPWNVVHGLLLTDTSEVQLAWGTAFLVLYAWWRERLREEPSVFGVQRMLRIGTPILLVVTTIVLTVPIYDGFQTHLIVGIVGFFGTTLLVLGALHNPDQRRGSASQRISRWLTSAAVPMLLIVVVAVSMAALLNGDLLHLLATASRPLVWVLDILFFAVVAAMIFILSLILNAISDFLTWVAGLWRPGSSDGSVDRPLPKVEPLTGDPASVPVPLRYLASVILIGTLVVLIVRMALGRAAPKRKDIEEERSSVFSWEGLVNSIAGRDTSKAQPRTVDDGFASLCGKAELAHTLRVREAYLAFQQQGRMLGRRRRRGETASQYRDILGPLAGARSLPLGPIDTLTMLYRQARYSGVPVTAAEASRAEAAVQTIERAISEDSENGSS